MPEPRIRRLHSRRARPGPGPAAPREAQPPTAADPPDATPEVLAGEAVIAVPTPVPPVPPVTDPREQLAPEEAESAEAEAAVLAAGDVAEEHDVPVAAAAVAMAAAAGEGAEPDEAVAESARGPAAQPEPEAEAEAEAEAEEPAAGELEPEAEEPGAEEPAAGEPEPEAEAEAEEPAAGEPEPEAEAEAEEPAAGEPEGWFREAPLDEGVTEGVDLDGWPAVAAVAVADTEPPVVDAGVEPEETFIRERDRPVVTPLPAAEPPRRRSRLQQVLIGVLTVFAVAVVGFVAGMMLPVIFPGPGVEPGSPSPSPTASSAPTPAPTATAAPTATPEPTAAPTPEPTPAPEPTPLIHVVQPGDQLGRIAARYGVTVDAIVEANDLANPNLIRVGQRLIIPLPEATPAP